ncbi:MAG: DUF1871 family protein, partial [Rhodothermales bacterium]
MHSYAKKKEDYKKAFTLVSKVLNEWDPYGLIASGSSSDEFDAEATAIVTQLPNIASPQDAARVISDVFKHWMSERDFPVVNCIESGQKLYLMLKEEN